jgi:hypothetical protein
VRIQFSPLLLPGLDGSAALARPAVSLIAIAGEFTISPQRNRKRYPPIMQEAAGAKPALAGSDAAAMVAQGDPRRVVAGQVPGWWSGRDAAATALFFRRPG